MKISPQKGKLKPTPPKVTAHLYEDLTPERKVNTYSTHPKVTAHLHEDLAPERKVNAHSPRVE